MSVKRNAERDRAFAGVSPANEQCLTEPEKRELARCEAIIDRGRKTYIEVGLALTAIQDGVLYKETHGTFEDYLRERFDMGTSHGYRLIKAAKTVELIRESVPNGDSGDVPKHESQVRELARIGNNLNVLAKVGERVKKAGGYGKVYTKDLAPIVTEEMAAWQAESNERQSTLRRIGLGNGLGELAAGLRIKPLSAYYQRWRDTLGEQEADEWLRKMRDDTAFILEQAEALLGEGDVDLGDLVAACEAVAA